MARRSEKDGGSFGLGVSQRQWQECQDASGRKLLRKIFPENQRQLREREARGLELARGKGVPELLDSALAGQDSQLPSLLMPVVGDIDLRMLVATNGPLPSDQVMALLAKAAAILKRLHALSLVHGDIKPANFVLGGGLLGAEVLGEGDELYLVDFENFVNVAEQNETTQLREGFTGGTPGIAPPEAYLGVPPNSRFDLYGLGSTLHFLLTGFLPRLASRGQLDSTLLNRLRPTLPERLFRLVHGLLSAQAQDRPSAQEVLDELNLANPPSTEELAVEACLLGAIEKNLHEGTLFDAQDERLLLRLHWSNKLESLLAQLPQTPPELSAREIVEGALKFCRAMQLCLEHLPLMHSARTRLQRAQKRLPDLLRRLPGEVRKHWDLFEIVEARHLARLSLNLCAGLSRLNLSTRDAPALIEATAQTLRTSLDRLGKQENQQRHLLTRIDKAESELDLDRAADALTQYQEGSSGASRMSASLRDRLHRLRWLLERLLGGAEAISKALPSLPENDEIKAAHDCIHELLEKARKKLGAKSKTEQQSYTNLGLTARLLTEIDEGYPRLGAAWALRAVQAIRLELSKRILCLQAAMHEKLDLDPIPIRLLLRDLEEAERILSLNGIVDTPRMQRSDILDELDRLRLRIEEVADQNERLKARASKRSEEGKLTTVLYDLERALKNLPADKSEEELLDWDLVEELGRVRRLRDRIRNAVRQNLELAQAYRTGQDSDESCFATLLDILEQREEVLLFLREKGPEESKEIYERDLHELRLARIQQISEEHELRYHAAEEQVSQCNIARSVLEILRKEESGGALAKSHSARLSRQLAHWETLYREAERKVEEAQILEARRNRIRSWMFRIASLAALLALYLLTVNFILPAIIDSRLDWPARLEKAERPEDLDSIIQDTTRDSDLRRALRNFANVLRMRRDLSQVGKPSVKQQEEVLKAVAALKKNLSILPKDDALLREAILRNLNKK